MQQFSITIEPRFYETDALGHINNATIAAWFETVRMKFLESLDGAQTAAAQHWLLASLQIDFVAETFFGRDVTARVTGAEVGNSSLTMLSEMYQDGRLTVRARGVLVLVDAQTRRSTRIPDNLREQLAAR